MEKLRVWWMPQVGTDATFYVPVETPEEAKKVMTILAAYDGFQYESRIKPDYANTGGLERRDESENEWFDWYYETDTDYFDDVEEYCESDCCNQKEELEAFSTAVLANWFDIRKDT